MKKRWLTLFLALTLGMVVVPGVLAQEVITVDHLTVTPTLVKIEPGSYYDDVSEIITVKAVMSNGSEKELFWKDLDVNKSYEFGGFVNFDKPGDYKHFVVHDKGKYKQEITIRVLGTLGDVDDDGFINAYDASLVLQYVARNISDNDIVVGSADVDGDGSITAYDASLILQYVANNIPDFPVNNQD